MSYHLPPGTYGAKDFAEYVQGVVASDVKLKRRLMSELALLPEPEPKHEKLISEENYDCYRKRVIENVKTIVRIKQARRGQTHSKKEYDVVMTLVETEAGGQWTSCVVAEDGNAIVRAKRKPEDMQSMEGLFFETCRYLNGLIAPAQSAGEGEGKNSDGTETDECHWMIPSTAQA